MALAPTRSMFRTTCILLMAAGIVAGCRRNPEDREISQPAPPPATLLAGGNRSLNDGLVDLEKELTQAISSGIDKSGEEHMLRAEAITDRLLEAQLPFTWLTANSYSLEGYVRQIQALADRIVAELRSGTDKAVINRDAGDLRRKVIFLRQDLARGGGKPPVPLDSLLAGVPADTVLPKDAGE